MKIGRNELCPCSSGEKYKHCCGAFTAPASAIEPSAGHLRRQQADELIRQRQQGRGQPIISVKHQGHQFVAVKDRLHFSKEWKTFPDFLHDYLTSVMDAPWLATQRIALPTSRHVLTHWYDEYHRYQKRNAKIDGELYSADASGIAACFLGLAYNLYLLDHNVELQERLVRRLRDSKNFQGAYYELIVANVLIRAGFELELEDESDPKTKHCEFAARSKETGQRYSVEAKMRAVSGLLGKTAVDGTSNPNALSQLIPHLNAALAKPSAGERLIFIDLNTVHEAVDNPKPRWLDNAVERIERFETDELPIGTTAYLFITNFPFHRTLEGNLSRAVLPIGVGIEDFNRPGVRRLSDSYLLKVKHQDAYSIAAALFEYPQIPNTLDGKMPSESFGIGPERIKVGSRYAFETPDGIKKSGVVESGLVIESEKRAYIVVSSDDVGYHTLSYALTDFELAEYRTHPEAYFGVLQHVGKRHENIHDFYEALVKTHEDHPREKLLAEMEDCGDIERLRTLSDIALRAEYCERLVMELDAKSHDPAGSQRKQSDMKD